MQRLIRQWAATPRQFFTVIVAVIVLYIFVNILGVALHLFSLLRDQAALERSNVELTTRIATLREQTAYMQTDSYIEQAAREMLLWGPAGARLVIIDERQDTAAPIATPAASPTRAPAPAAGAPTPSPAR